MRKKLLTGGLVLQGRRKQRFVSRWCRLEYSTPCLVRIVTASWRPAAAAPGLVSPTSPSTGPGPAAATTSTTGTGSPSCSSTPGSARRVIRDIRDCTRSHADEPSQQRGRAPRQYPLLTHRDAPLHGIQTLCLLYSHVRTTSCEWRRHNVTRFIAYSHVTFSYTRWLSSASLADLVAPTWINFVSCMFNHFIFWK